MIVKKGDKLNKLHRELLNDIRDVYKDEIDLISDEKRLVELIKIYETKVIDKDILKKARAKPQEDLQYIGIDDDAPSNIHGKVVLNLRALVNSLENNIGKQMEQARKDHEELTNYYNEFLKHPNYSKNESKKDKDMVAEFIKLLMDDCMHSVGELKEILTLWVNKGKIESPPEEFFKLFKKVFHNIEKKNKKLEELKMNLIIEKKIINSKKLDFSDVTISRIGFKNYYE